MWLGNHAQVNATSGTPSTGAEADPMAGYGAVGTAQIKPATIKGDTRTITADGKQVEAFATSYTDNSNGRDVADSRMTYEAPQSGQTVSTTITGFLSVRYQLTFPDGGLSEQDGVLIQMKNGDMFFRPRKMPCVNGTASTPSRGQEPVGRSAEPEHLCDNDLVPAEDLRSADQLLYQRDADPHRRR
jgi:hypothetical protein